MQPYSSKFGSNGGLLPPKLGFISMTDIVPGFFRIQSFEFQELRVHP